jgi:hypothetical protein
MGVAAALDATIYLPVYTVAIRERVRTARHCARRGREQRFEKPCAQELCGCYVPRALWEGLMARNDAKRPEAQKRVIEEWLRLPASRRQHATDAVAFAFRLMREEPTLLNGGADAGYELILQWLTPHLSKIEAS